MGFYINPENESKEEFLNREGTLCDPKFPTDNTVGLVCLVDNILFTAAAVCVDNSEFLVFNDVEDDRLKKWYLVSRYKLFPVVQPDLKEVWNEDCA